MSELVLISTFFTLLSCQGIVATDEASINITSTFASTEPTPAINNSYINSTSSTLGDEDAEKLAGNDINVNQQFLHHQQLLPPLLASLLRTKPTVLLRQTVEYLLLLASTRRTLQQNRRRILHNLILGLIRHSLIARVLNLIRSHLLFRMAVGGPLRRFMHWWENRRFAPVKNTLRKLWRRRLLVKLRVFVRTLLDDVNSLWKLFNYLHRHVPPGRFWGGLMALRTFVPIPILVLILHLVLRHVKLGTVQIVLEQLLDNGLFIIISQVVKGYKVGFRT